MYSLALNLWAKSPFSRQTSVTEDLKSMVDRHNLQECKLLSISQEVLSMILDHCDISDLKAMACTCKTLNEQTILLRKYRKIDISAHNDDMIEFIMHGGNIQYIPSDHYPPAFDLAALATKQQTFLSAILERPYKVKLVHDFTWTLRSYYNPSIENHRAEEKDVIYPDTKLWAAFQKFTAVTKVDLACYQESWDWTYLRQPPPILFPAATDIRLSGLMYRQIVEAVLNPVNLPNLESISIDNLQDPGFTKDEYPFQETSNWRSVATIDNRKNGMMRDILPIIQDQCTSLRSFYYRKPGAYCRGASGISNGTGDRQCYREFANFVEATRMTLVNITFEHGVSEFVTQRLREGTENDMDTCVSHSRNQAAKPMDHDFIDLVLPTLMRCKWPQLQQLNIVGVGRWNGTAAMSKGQKLGLRTHLGRSVRVVVQEIADRPCEEFRL